MTIAEEFEYGYGQLEVQPAIVITPGQEEPTNPVLIEDVSDY